jgi:hypothetical protein
MFSETEILNQNTNFVNYVIDCFHFYKSNNASSCKTSVLSNSIIKNNYGQNLINIDILILINLDIFLIQCNFNNDRPSYYNVKALILDCDILKKRFNKSYKYHLIYLSRIALEVSGLEYLKYNNGINIFLYDYPYKQIYCKENEYLLMRLYNYIVNITNCRLGLKEYSSIENDVLMSYLV